MASVTLQDVRKVFRNTVVVERLNLNIEDGEFLVLVGPSGCGKSTTLNMIAGLENVTEGRIAIGGRPVTSLAPKDRNVAMVFQNYALYPHMSVRDNLGFGLKVRGTERAEIATRVNAAADTLGIAALLDRRPRELSGGQRQRVALGRAIVRDPDVFLFDEPLSNLDAQLRVQMRFELKQLHQRLAATAIYVTHDQVEAMTLGSRLVVMNRGIIQQIGPPLELYHHPRNRFVAEFIGSPAINLFRCTVAGSGADTALQCGSMRFRISERASAALRNGSIPTATCGIRPEHIRLVTHESSGEPDMRAIIEDIEPLGHQAYVRIASESLRATVLMPAERQIGSVGDSVGVQFDWDKLHCFRDDAEGGVL